MRGQREPCWGFQVHRILCLNLASNTAPAVVLGLLDWICANPGHFSPFLLLQRYSADYRGGCYGSVEFEDDPGPKKEGSPPQAATQCTERGG